MATPKLAATAAEPIQRLIYLGPNHPRGLIVNSTIFKGGTPQGITDLLEKCPSAKALLVPTNQAAQVMQGIRNSESVYATLYKQADTEFRQEG